MSKSFGKKVEYTCSNNCRQEGCPGHIVQVNYNASTDNMEALIDDQLVYSINDSLWAAMIYSDRNE